MPTTTFAPIITNYQLTRDDIAALKACDEITLHLNRTGSYLMARLRTYGGTQRIYTAREQRLFNQVGDIDGERVRRVDTSVYVNVYSDRDYHGWDYPAYEDKEPRPGCFYTWYDRATRGTIAGLLRAGDTLTLLWVGSNNSETLRSARLHNDYVRLITNRGDTKLTFEIGHQTSPDNSARMIRRHDA